ncbi:MAG: hypothetical protein HOM58_19435 [Rhodospirillaceae bacterium]|jgi:hypothetical protein|nr:hypothetical protein [Rhodospirillaceae bacterium]MBT5457375.1 hypothetical protein [Rhodospirillaceae bacterium]
MLRLMAVILLMPLLLSCAETYTDLPRQYIDRDFQRVSLTNRIGAHKGIKVRYYIKTFEKEGKLAICGAYLNDGTGIAEAFGEWVSRASVTIGSRDNIVAPARFMGEVYRRGERAARCVKTELVADDFLLNGRARLVGKSVRMY